MLKKTEAALVLKRLLQRISDPDDQLHGALFAEYGEAVEVAMHHCTEN